MPATMHHGPGGSWSATIEERREHIRLSAPCTSCGATLGECERLKKDRADQTAPEWLGCCAVGLDFRPCVHREDSRALSALLAEVADGEVRTVEEANPAPVQGPRLPGMDWLLWQNTWWYPKRRPAIRIAEMDKTHRYNTANFLERQAFTIVRGQSWSMACGPQPSGDMASDAFEAELDGMDRDPAGWLRDTPLLRALRRGLPTGGLKLKRLAERARHWHTCPMRLIAAKRPAFASCTCPPPAHETTPDA